MQHDPLDFVYRPLVTAVQRKRRAARRILLLEQFSLALWHPVFWVCAFFGLWMLGLSDYISPGFQLATALLFFIGLIWGSIKGLKHLHWPHEQDIDRRLEIASAAPHHPLAFLQDKAANAKTYETIALWERARHHAWDNIKRLKVPMPRALITKLDPYAVRLLALLLLITGAAVAGPDWQDRIKTGLFPAHSLFPRGLPKTITLTITPPTYTGLPQTILSGPGWNNTPVEVPIGSSLKATAQASFGTPLLVIGNTSYKFEAQGQSNFTLEASLVQGDLLGVSRFGIPVMSVPLSIIPDAPPRISAFQEEPEYGEAAANENAKTEPYTVLPDHTLRFGLNVEDDYGVKDLHMRMELDPMIEDAPLGDPEEETRAISSPAGQAQRTDPVYDFTASPWAGLPARITFSVTDHAGQTGTMPALSITLPEREFRHPVARILVELRKKLIWSPLAPPDEIVDTLETLLSKPGAFQNDQIAFLGITVAAARLKYAKRYGSDLIANSRSTVDLLWDTALRIEDGNLSLAARNLRDAQRDLENALRDGTMSKEEMMQLTDKVRELLGQYLSELQEELQKRMESGEQMPFMPPEMLSKSIDPGKMDGFMQQMLEEMMDGNPEKAQEMLSQLQKMLDSMNPSLAMPMPLDMQMMQQGVSEMQQLIDRQEELLTQTKLQAESLQTPNKAFEQLQKLIPLAPQMFENFQIPQRIPHINELEKPDPAVVDTQANKTEQDALRYVLGQLMLDAGEVFKDIPQNLGYAEMEMRESADRLGENRPDHSVPHQEEALRHLKEAQEQMQQEMQQMMQQMMAGSGSPLFFAMPSFGQRQLDPLGRPFSDDQNGDPNSVYAPVEIPDEAERRRAQEIQKLLRDRSGELYRPREELDYFRRLLKQF
ncbi:MAG: DUF4175 domain-containing protein [Alphaproteobacteria bacterium]|nr:DUF4175 domain-containing protein [Alphaproteobacteria bacterium]MCD8520158.1 DUF4175 domain-containing protein [Alphaproteobacteria bacterium]